MSNILLPVLLNPTSIIMFYFIAKNHAKREPTTTERFIVVDRGPVNETQPPARTDPAREQLRKRNDTERRKDPLPRHDRHQIHRENL